ncbi:glycosyltransferase family 9 protein [bacterium]|nr:glycosyltransferase family 9 protein [bacterium]
MKRILIVRPDAIGDVVLMTPMLQRLKAHYPSAQISVLLQMYTVPLLSEHDDVFQIIEDWKKAGRAKGLLGFFEYVKEIRSHDFDCVIFSYIDEYYAKLCFFAGIPCRIGDGNRLSTRVFLSHKINQSFRNLFRHEVEQNFSLLEPLGIQWSMDSCKEPISKIVPCFKTPSSSDIQTKLIDQGWNGVSPLIIIHPSSGGGNRAWKPELYGKLIDLIHENTDCKIVVTGAGEVEAKIVAIVLKNSKSEVINLVNKTSLHELMDLVQLADCVIGTDTGPTHIAAAYGCRVLSVSPTKFVKAMRWGPWLTNSAIVSKSSRCKKVCFPYKCGLDDCLIAIQPEDVLAELLKIKETDNFDHYKKDRSQKPESIGDSIQVIQKNKMCWFKASGKVLLFVTRESKQHVLEYYLGLFKKNGVEVEIATRHRLKQLSLNSDLLYSKFGKKIQEVRLSQLIKFISKEDIIVIHGLNLNWGWKWNLIKQLAALFVYCPPILFNQLDDELREWPFLFSQFQRLYQGQK